MDQWDLLFFTVYAIVVAYVFYRAVKSLQIEVIIKLDRDFLNAQLDAQNLKDLIDVQFKLAKQYKLDEVRDLSISIQNKSQYENIYVEWDRSSLTDLSGRSRRVIRIIPGMTLDLFQPQVMSAIPAGKTLTEKLTIEDALKRDVDGGMLKIAAPIFSLTEKQINNDFIAKNKQMKFSLRLCVRVFEQIRDSQGAALPSLPTAVTSANTNAYILACEFTITKLPLLLAMRWKKRK